MPLPTDDYVDQYADEYGLDKNLMRRIMNIESSGNPNAKTGSYKGLFQLSDPEFNATGVGGNIYNPNDNAKAAAIKFRGESNRFSERYGRQPSATELYLMHQQGEAGFDAHFQNPTLPAWQNMLSTGEGKQKGEAWAKKAIWGNIPNDLKKQYGNVENVSSQDFMNLWKSKVEGVPLATVQQAQSNGVTPTSQTIANNMNAKQAQQNAQNFKQAMNLFNKPIPEYDYMLPVKAQQQFKLVPIAGNPFAKI